MTVYGISLDDVASQAAFAELHELDYELLSDPDGSATSKYAAMMDRRRFAQRVTFVIDPKGVLRHIDKKVDVRNHGDDLIELIKSLKREK